FAESHLSFSRHSGESASALKLWELGFAPVNQIDCFEPVSTPGFLLPSAAHQALELGGKLVATTSGYKIMVAFDPIKLNLYLRRYRYDDIVLAGTRGFEVVERQRLNRLPMNSIEIFQRPQDAYLCW